MRMNIVRLPRMRRTPVRFVATLETSFGYDDHVIAMTLPVSSRNDAARDSERLHSVLRAQWEREEVEAENREIAAEIAAERARSQVDWLPHPSESMFAWENGGPGLPGYDWPEDEDEKPTAG